jgi:hypothetical protein
LLALQDNNERTVRLESYIKNLELEKAEYENTIRTLKLKIINLEDTKSCLHLSNLCVSVLELIVVEFWIEI